MTMKLPEIHQNRSVLTDFDQAIRLNLRDANVYGSLIDALIYLNKPKEALRYAQEAMWQGYDHPEPLNKLAWVLASHQDARLRDGTQAVRLCIEERFNEFTSLDFFLLAEINDHITVDTLEFIYDAFQWMSLIPSAQSNFIRSICTQD